MTGIHDIPMCWITLPATLLYPPHNLAAIMSLEAARGLSILDLISVMNEKLNMEWSGLLETPLPPVVSQASVESEVRAT